MILTKDEVDRIFRMFCDVPARDRRHATWVMTEEYWRALVDSEITRLSRHYPLGTPWPQPRPDPENPGTLLGRPIRLALVGDISVEVPPRPPEWNAEAA